MRIFETKQRAEGGGSPLDNRNGVFEHGDVLFIIDRDDFLELLDDLQSLASPRYRHRDQIIRILREAGGYQRTDGTYVVTKELQPCEHQWVRRRDGRQCTRCETIEFGVFR